MTECCASPPREEFDVAVIGAGSAGFSAAITAANAGARVALIGDGTIGGTCVNTGCVPSKTMIRAAEALHCGSVAARFDGIVGEARLSDWSALIAAKDNLVLSLRQKKYVDLLPAYPGIDYIEGAARFEGEALHVSGKPLDARRIIIATGSSPAMPEIPGVADVPVLTSTSALDLTERPASLIVLGGGYIGCELAQMFGRMGTAVTLVTRSRLLPEAEPELSSALAGYLGDEGITVRMDLNYVGVVPDPVGVALTISSGGGEEMLTAARMLAATGRRANTATLNLAAAGIRTDADGAIVVDDRMRTTRDGIYAAGDVTGRDQFVYMAAYGAKLAARHAISGYSAPYENRTMPWVVFTDPQVAGVGMSEAQARARGHAIKTSVVTLENVPRALAARDTRGLIKLVADAGTDRLLGGQILAPEGADSIQTLAMALTFGMTAKALGESLFPYLTTVEGLKLAAQGFEGDVAKLSCCAG